MPRPRLSQLIGARRGVHARNWVHPCACEAGTEPFEAPVGCCARSVFAPDLVKGVPRPIGEEADAVRRREDLVELRQPGVDGEIDEHVLRNVECRFDIERHPGDDTEPAEPDDGRRAIVGTAFDSFDRPVCVHDVDRGHRAGEVLIAIAGTVRGRGDRSADRQVGERCEVVQGVPLRVEPRSELRVPDAGLDGDRVGGAIEIDDGRHVIHDDEDAVGRSDRTETVACSDGAHSTVLGGAPRDDLLQRFHGSWPLDRRRRELGVARPVALDDRHEHCRIRSRRRRSGSRPDLATSRRSDRRRRSAGRSHR